MTKLMAMLVAARGFLLAAVQPLAFWTPGLWCRKQRRLLLASAGSVVWLRGDAVRWGEWGAARGYFQVQYMDGLPYLSAVTVRST